MTKINPYITFDGNCEEAFNFYKGVFGGDFQFMGRFSEMPKNDKYPVSEDEKNKIMHVSFPIGENVIMGSDSSKAFGKDTVQGNNFSISVDTDTVEEAQRIFSELSKDGQIKMPLEKTFWGAYFGMLIDKFGIHWMLNHELREHKDFEMDNKSQKVA